MPLRRLLVQEFVTVDGFAAAPDGALDYMPGGGQTPADHGLERHQVRFIREEVDTMLLGRATYEMFREYWPTAASADDVIADDLNALSKVVASSTLDAAPWGAGGDYATVIRDGVEGAAELRKQSGKAIVVWGSLTLTQALLRADLVDECHLFVCPSVLGEGRPLFAPDDGLRSMRLLDTVRFESGVMLLRYAP